MATKDVETIRQETLERRLELHRLMRFQAMTQEQALKIVLPDSKTRKRTFETWKKKGLWPLSEEEEMRLRGRKPLAEHPESKEAGASATPLITFGFTQPEPTVTQPQVTDEVEFDFSDSESETSVTEPATPECAVPPQEHTEEVEPEPAVVTQQVSQSTQATEEAPALSAQPSLTQLQREEIEGMIQDMVQKEVERALSSVTPTLPSEQNPDIDVRPLFRREETVTRSIRISKSMAEQAEVKAKQERVTTGGNLNSLIEVLLWNYLDRPNDLIEDES